MNMTRLMNEMVQEVSKSFGDNCYAFAHRDTEHGKVTLYALKVNTNATSCIQKRWKLDGKAIAAKKLQAL